MIIINSSSSSSSNHNSNNMVSSASCPMLDLPPEIRLQEWKVRDLDEVQTMWNNCASTSPPLHKDSEPIRYLAVEFDTSWNDDWPEYFFHLWETNTARGKVVNLLLEAAVRKETCFLYLIDRDTPAPKEFWGDDGPCRVFSDQDGMEYVDTKWWDMDWEQRTGKSVFAFIEGLNRYRRKWAETTDPNFADPGKLPCMEWLKSFNLERYVGVLTCRKSQESSSQEP